MLFGFFMSDLVILGQTIVKLEVADKLKPREKMILSKVCGFKLLFQHVDNYDSLFFS